MASNVIPFPAPYVKRDSKSPIYHRLMAAIPLIRDAADCTIFAQEYFRVEDAMSFDEQREVVKAAAQRSVDVREKAA